MPCLFESGQVSVSVRDISLLHQNCRAEFCSPHENMPCWFHLISDHRLCSPVIIRKYLFQTLCARNVILWLKETLQCGNGSVEKNTSRLKNVLKRSLTLQACVCVFLFFFYEQPISYTSTCQQPNHQTTYMQHIWNQMWARAATTTLTKPRSSQAGGRKWVQIMTHHPETAVGDLWERKVGWQGSGDVCGVPFKAREEEPVKAPATGEKGASHGPLCINDPTSRPVSPAPAVSLPPDTFSLPTLAGYHPGKFVFVCVPLSQSLLWPIRHFTDFTPTNHI